MELSTDRSGTGVWISGCPLPIYPLPGAYAKTYGTWWIRTVVRRCKLAVCRNTAIYDYYLYRLSAYLLKYKTAIYD